MTLRLSILFATAWLFFGAHAVYANPIPRSTDEARALTSNLSAAQPIRPVASVNPIVTSTDEARALFGSILPSPLTQSIARVASIVTTTDESRATAGARVQEMVQWTGR